MVIPLFGISKVVISDLWISFLSSDATCVAIASFVLLYPSASATSLPTNHTTPSISTVLSSPNCGWLNTVGTSMDNFASGSIRGIYFSDPLTEQNFLPISLTHSHFGNLLFFKYQNGSRDLHNSRYVHLWHTLIRHERWMGNTQLFSLKNFMKYCWLYSSILLRNQSQFPAEHFPSYTRKTDSQTVDSAKTSISLVTSPLYSRIFFCFAIVIIPFFGSELWGSYFLSLTRFAHSFNQFELDLLHL